MLSIIFASSFVAGQIVTEKSSKIVEYLLTSVKPMAIITGKVFASVSVVLTILASFSICIVISGILNGVINMNGNGVFVLPTIISDLIDSEVMAGANPLTILLALAIIILGFVFYCFLGGVSGAMVSKIEELGEGTKLLNFAMIIGAYLALGLIMSSSLGGSGWGDLNYLVYFLPLSAPFIVPSYLLFGIISPAIGLAVVALNIVLTSGLVVFVSKVYEQLIYHNGNPLKIKDLFHLSKNKVKKND
jgi:ABC-2 type transport system permease protein